MLAGLCEVWAGDTGELTMNRHRARSYRLERGRPIFLVVLPPAGDVYCGGYCCAHWRNDARTGRCCEDTACVRWHCCCDSSEHGEGVCVLCRRISGMLVDERQWRSWVAEGNVEKASGDGDGGKGGSLVRAPSAGARGVLPHYIRLGGPYLRE